MVGLVFDILGEEKLMQLLVEQIIVSKVSLSQVRRWCDDGTIKSGMHITMFFRCLSMLHRMEIVDATPIMLGEEDL